MSKNKEFAWTEIGDVCALEIQELHAAGKLPGDQPLLRIDYRTEMAQAPFQFDMVNSRLHRSDCTHIPRNSKSAIYAVWRIGDEDNNVACERCRPVLERGDLVSKEDNALDIMYGVLSIVDQFVSVLRERGKEYRTSKHGRALIRTLESVLSEWDHKQQEVLNVTVSVLDSVLKIVHDYDASVQRQGRNESSSGPNGAGSKRSRRRSEEKSKRTKKIREKMP